MPNPSISQNSAADTTAAPPPNEPVNVARPNWACPHCRSEYGADYERAQQCAAAGPPPDIVAEGHVLIIGVTSDKPTFGELEVGPTRPITEDGVAKHERTLTVSGKHISVDQLARARTANDGLRIIGASPRIREDEPADGHAGLHRLFTHGQDYQDPAIWFDNWMYGKERWVRRPEPAEREALNVLTDGLLDRTAQADPEKFRMELLENLRRGGHRRSGWTVANVANPNAYLDIALAHGSPNRVWAQRWLIRHLDDIVAWYGQALQSWATSDPSGTAANVIVPLPDLRAANSLPRNPGKRRTAILEPFGSGYRDSMSTLVQRLLLETPPTNPVPGLPDVPTTIRALGATHSEGATTP